MFTCPVPLGGLDFFTPSSGLSFLFFFYFSSTLPWPKPAVMGLRAISISFKVSKTGTRFRPKPLLQAEGNVVDDVFDNSKDSSRKLQVQLRETNRSWLISLFGYLKVGTKLEKLEVKESIDLETEFWVLDFSLVYVKKERIVAYIFECWYRAQLNVDSFYFCHSCWYVLRWDGEDWENSDLDFAAFDFSHFLLYPNKGLLLTSKEIRIDFVICFSQ